MAGNKKQLSKLYIQNAATSNDMHLEIQNCLQNNHAT